MELPLDVVPNTHTLHSIMVRFTLPELQALLCPLTAQPAPGTDALLVWSHLMAFELDF